MSLNKKIAIPLLLVLLASAAGGGWYAWQHKGHDHGAEGNVSQGK